MANFSAVQPSATNKALAVGSGAKSPLVPLCYHDLARGPTSATALRTFPSARSDPEELSEHSALPRIQHDIRRVKIHPDPARAIDGSVDERESLLSPIRVSHAPVPYRAQMERAFGADFSTVNSLPGQSALLAPLGARAAAWPETVVFSSTTPPARVVAHELAHVLQYRNAPKNSAASRGVAARNDPAEVEARRAAIQIAEGRSMRLRAHPGAALMLYTDEEDLDSEEYLQERPPHFANQEVGQWGNLVPATLIARERLEVSFPETERSNAILEAIFRREPLVIMREFHRLWLYRLEWEGFSARYSRFTNAATIFHEGSGEKGDYSVSNVEGRPEVEAFVTEDGGVLSPPGAGKLFFIRAATSKIRWSRASRTRLLSSVAWKQA